MIYVYDPAKLLLARMACVHDPAKLVDEDEICMLFRHVTFMEHLSIEIC